MRVAHVIVDIPTRALDSPFDYAVPPGMDAQVGSCVLVDFGHRPAVGYVVRLADHTDVASLKPLKALLGGPFFTPSPLASRSGSQPSTFARSPSP